MRALELFCGIGGFAAATEGTGIDVVGALDQDPEVLGTYRLNFPDHQAHLCDLEKSSAWTLSRFRAQLWWLSPPCQPYCQQGRRHDLDDYRATSFSRVLDVLSVMREEDLPEHIALENVEGFMTSRARGLLLSTLESRKYRPCEFLLCPTQLGIPSRRPRYYLAASRTTVPTEPAPSPLPARSLASYLETPPDEELSELLVPEETVDKFGKGMRILDPDYVEACTTCFTSAYGRAVMHSGSYLRCGDRARRFTPKEIANLLHLPERFTFPAGTSLRRSWGMVGNSLSVAAVREVLGCLGVR